MVLAGQKKNIQIVRIISEDTTNEGAAKFNHGWGGNSSCAQHACCTLNCTPHSILKIIAEITGNVGSEWGRAVSSDKYFSGAAWPKSFSLLKLWASFSDLMRIQTEKEKSSNKLDAYFNSFTNIRPISWKMSEKCWPEKGCLHGTGDLSRAGEPKVALGFWRALYVVEEQDRIVI